jgi:hypothetical protein
LTNAPAHLNFIQSTHLKIMLTLACPDESLPEWKELVAALGERRAFVAFFRNKYDVPRDIELALDLLTLDKVKWRSVDGRTLEQIKQAKAATQKEDATPAKPTTSIRSKLIRDGNTTLIWSKTPAVNQSLPNSTKTRSKARKSNRRKSRDAAVQPEFKI